MAGTGTNPFAPKPRDGRRLPTVRNCSPRYIEHAHDGRVVGDFCQLLEAIDHGNQYRNRSMHDTCNHGCYFDIIQVDSAGNETVIAELIETYQTLITRRDQS